ncbi:alpha/beta hydrolase [Romeria aff. gracilis LEGE 07310]|uniref:Alpha/beta hydrolase n=1 Tax=Vasconcelosia minhoensis LEGE 07310 TaxID=915328 RepID=A0A8J7AKF8_9CYAN|nr:alpha/beta hydrolase [Romeria gracilis]MBE9079363.1 alpha/beta hydrolase [Romeria aff. gracilis LEGE 07310]
MILNYGLVERSVAVDDLETYAREGRLSETLESYARYFTPTQLERFRVGLTASTDLDVVAISQFLYTPQGEALLRELGEIIQSGGRQNGFLAIRGSVILAAADPNQGLTLLNVLKKFPTPVIRIDLRQASNLTGDFIGALNQTEATAALIQNLSAQAAAEQSLPNPSTELASPGSFLWDVIPLEGVALPTNLYLPQRNRLNASARPVVVLSHGLGGSQRTLAYLAEHLASYGFAVLVVEHPGSSEEQLSALLSGQASRVTPPDELTRRPLAIQELLNDLTHLTRLDARLRGRLDLRRIGVMGQSFGAYTTLALAGAEINLERLEAACPPEFDELNLSLLLQCLALELPQPLPQLGDPRIRAAIAVNPLDSAIFGQASLAEIDIPMMLVSGSADTVTPALAEQIRPFTWLTTPEKYLLQFRGGTHFSIISGAETEGAVPVPDAVIGPSPETAERYIRAMSVAFFATHLTEDPAYRPYLSAAYASQLSQSELPLSLIQSLSPEQLP